VIFLVALQLLAGSIQDRIKRIVGEDRYYQNRAVIATLFSNPSRYTTNGRIDLQKVVALLERVGILSKRYPTAIEGSLEFVGDQKPYLFLRLCDMALFRGNVFRSHLSSIKRGTQIEAKYSFYGKREPRLSKMIAFFHMVGVNVTDLVKVGDGWRFSLSLSSAHMLAKPPHGILKVGRNGVWVDVCAKSEVRLKAGRIWYPSVAIYNEDLTPLDLVENPDGVRSISFTLPNGACYIKISDMFSAKNLKGGLHITAR